MLILKDSSVEEILEFLTKAEAAGKNIPTQIGSPITLADGSIDFNAPSVAYEARQIKSLFLRLHEF